MHVCLFENMGGEILLLPFLVKYSQKILKRLSIVYKNPLPFIINFVNPLKNYYEFDSENFPLLCFQVLTCHGKGLALVIYFPLTQMCTFKFFIQSLFFIFAHYLNFYVLMFFHICTLKKVKQYLLCDSEGFLRISSVMCQRCFCSLQKLCCFFLFFVYFQISNFKNCLKTLTLLLTKLN